MQRSWSPWDLRGGGALQDGAWTLTAALSEVQTAGEGIRFGYACWVSCKPHVQVNLITLRGMVMTIPTVFPIKWSSVGLNDFPKIIQLVRDGTGANPPSVHA